jgi:hypothetical protein
MAYTLDNGRYIVYTKRMIRNNDTKKGNEMTNIKLNNNGTVAGIEIVKVHFRHYFAKYNGKTIEGTRWHNETGSKMEANKILKEMK